MFDITTIGTRAISMLGHKWESSKFFPSIAHFTNTYRPVTPLPPNANTILKNN